MKILKRLVALLLSLAVITVFYLLAVMMEDEESKRTDQFVVEAQQKPLTPIQEIISEDPQRLVDAFGVPIPLPDRFESGRVTDFTWHTYPARLITLTGAQAVVKGVRPAAAAPSIIPKDADFKASDKALLGYAMLEAQVEGKTLYSLITRDAAFLIEPQEQNQPGGFALLEPK
ncbi:MAG: hypothetical protein GXZ04_00355 [Clostridiales bacterium]|nr:hypothetical protein [Clostridiales bacterium]